MWTRCLGGFSVMWVTKLMISQVKKRIFCPKTTKFGPTLAFLVIFGQALPAHLVPCWLVVVARGLYLARHLFTLYISWINKFGCIADTATQKKTICFYTLHASRNFFSAPHKYLSAHFWFLHCFTRPSAHHLAYSFIHFQYLLFQLLPVFRASTLKENRSAHRYQVLSTWTSLNGSKSSTIISPLNNHVAPLHSWC